MRSQNAEGLVGSISRWHGKKDENVQDRAAQEFIKTPKSKIQNLKFLSTIDVISTSYNFLSQLLISVIHSIPDNEALIDTVLSHYPISDIRNCKLYKRRLNDIKPDSYTN